MPNEEIKALVFHSAIRASETAREIVKRAPELEENVRALVGRAQQGSWKAVKILRYLNAEISR